MLDGPVGRDDFEPDHDLGMANPGLAYNSSRKIRIGEANVVVRLYSIGATLTPHNVHAIRWQRDNDAHPPINYAKVDFLADFVFHPKEVTSLVPVEDPNLSDVTT